VEASHAYFVLTPMRSSNATNGESSFGHRAHARRVEADFVAVFVTEQDRVLVRQELHFGSCADVHLHLGATSCVFGLSTPLS
jgi:hypothetical protein